METYNPGELARLLQSINEAKAYVVGMCDRGEADKKVPRVPLETTFIPLIALARDHANRLELQSTLNRVAEDHGYLHLALSQEQGITFEELRHQLAFLRESIEADLEKQHFVFISSSKVAVLLDMTTQWEEVWRKLPDCRSDTQEAVYCYCLDRYTASVFHSMRVSEHGLRNIAKRVGVKLIDRGKPQPIDFATWGKVIDGIKVKIAKAQSLPQGPRRNRKLQFCSDAAENCTYIRDIWRNEVSHTRKSYNEREAISALNRVRDFMQFLVGAPK